MHVKSDVHEVRPLQMVGSLTLDAFEHVLLSLFLVVVSVHQLHRPAVFRVRT